MSKVITVEASDLEVLLARLNLCKSSFIANELGLKRGAYSMFLDRVKTSGRINEDRLGQLQIAMDKFCLAVQGISPETNAVPIQVAERLLRGLEESGVNFISPLDAFHLLLKYLKLEDEVGEREAISRSIQLE